MDGFETVPNDPPPMPPVKPARAGEADQLERLIAALHAQTAALHELAESNRAVVDMLLARDAEEPDEAAAPSRYLDGTPREL